LLGDSARALQAIAEKIVYERTQHGRRISAMMFAELLVLLEHDGLTDNVRNVLGAKNDDLGNEREKGKNGPLVLASERRAE